MINLIMKSGYKDPERQLKGAASKAIGEAFENYIRAACIYYRLKKFAEIEKTPEPMRVIKNIGQGKFIAYFEKQAQPDYKGCLNGGKTVVFEAKYTEKDHIDQNRLTEEQADELERYSNMGAWCFVLVSIKMQNFYRVPWKVWKNMKTLYNRKYMTAEELKKFEIPMVSGIIKVLDEVK